MLKQLLQVGALLLAIGAAHGQSSTAERTMMTDLPVTELSYPRSITTSAGKLVIHAPQIDSWPDYQRISGRSAIEVTLAGSNTSSPGTMFFEGNSKTDFVQRVVGLYNLRVTKTSFPGADSARAAQLNQFTQQTASSSAKKVPLDLVLSYVADTAVLPADNGLSFEPPRIFYSTKPAILLVLDGPPIKAPIKGTGLSYAVNTNWDLFWLDTSSRWYLRNDTQWLVSKDASLARKWKITDELPVNFTTLPAEDNWKDVRAQIPPPDTATKLPVVFVSEQPAELIVSDGKPRFETINNTELSYATNTTSDLFRIGNTYYYLVSGRWFSTTDLQDGDWSPVKALPTVFAGIPRDHSKARVRVAVPGTEEAKLAMLEAGIPRTATVRADAAPQITVVYHGEPQFEPIPETTLQRAVNTPFDVIRYREAFYLCYNATWYVAMSANGPWTVAPKVPEEIYDIPPSSPAYHVTHVRVYANTDDTVTTGYTSGYYGTYATSTTIVYGTGWYYPPYYYYDDYYPYYYYHPVSYGRGTWYNPDTGVYGGAEAIYGPYGGAGRAAVYNPDTGTYARGRAVWDDDEMAGQAIGYNPRTGTGVATDRYRSEDSYWGETLVKRDDNWVYTQSDWQDGSGTTDFATSRGTTGTISGERDGDTLNTESTIERNGETVTGQGEWTSAGGSTELESSSGATATVNREFDDGQITGDSTISKGDSSATTEMVRTEDGVARQVTSDSGETVTTVRGQGSDDLYAAKDGEVYKRTEDGWQQHGADGWQPVESKTPRRTADTPAQSTAADKAAAANAGAEQPVAGRMLYQDQARQVAAESVRAQSSQQIPVQREMGSRATEPSPSMNDTGDRNSSYGNQRSTNDRRNYDAQRSRDLDRDYRARQSGYNNFNQRRSMGGGTRGGGRRR